jgi:RNA polymerase sigma-70 factor (ECF subfamily)
VTPLEDAVAANSRDLLAYLQRRTGHPEDAADLLGDVLLVAWRRAQSLPADALEARLWLFGIASRTVLNHRRARRRRSAAIDRLRDDILTTQRAEPESADAEDVRAAVAALPTREAELVRLIHWEGFSIAEAAAITHTNASTARSRYASARTRLRTALGTPLGQSWNRVSMVGDDRILRTE